MSDVTLTISADAATQVQQAIDERIDALYRHHDHALDCEDCSFAHRGLREARIAITEALYPPVEPRDAAAVR